MAVKRYIDDEWVTISGLQGPVGETGPVGPTGVFRGNSEPEDTSLLWVDLDDPGSFVPYSAPTLGSTSIDSGATVTTIAGLTLTTPNIGVATATSINGTEIPANKTLLATDTTAFVATAGGSNITVASGSTVPLRITNEGTGNSFVVEDSTNPDATPFVINAAGQITTGDTSPLSILNPANNLSASPRLSIAGTSSGDIHDARIIYASTNTTVAAPYSIYGRSNTTTIGGQGAAASGDVMGGQSWQASDGTSIRESARITGFVDGTVSTGIVPGRLVLSTANSSGTMTERMRIDSAGNTTINAIADATTTTAARGAGYMGVPPSAAATTGAYTIVAADAGEHIYSTATRTITIPANGSVAFPVGTAITFIAATGTTVTIAITTDTLLLAGAGTTGSRTLAPFGMATAIKITSTSWIISGNGLT